MDPATPLCTSVTRSAESPGTRCPTGSSNASEDGVAVPLGGNSRSLEGSRPAVHPECSTWTLRSTLEMRHSPIKTGTCMHSYKYFETGTFNPFGGAPRVVALWAACCVLFFYLARDCIWPMGVGSRQKRIRIRYRKMESPGLTC